eukprot:2610458-Prymnesium_polylepis.1
MPAAARTAAVGCGEACESCRSHLRSEAGPRDLLQPFRPRSGERAPGRRGPAWADPRNAATQDVGRAVRPDRAPQ